MIIASIFAVLGLVLGSFAAATVWRVRARQLKEDEQAGDVLTVKQKKLKGLATKSLSDDRSQCLHCGHQLAWYDLVPLVSWVSLRGRCRYCHKRIGWMEPLAEVAMALMFVVSYLYWPIPLDSAAAITLFALWLVAVVLLGILLMYDARWFLLPDKVMIPLFVTVCGMFVINVVTSDNGFALIFALIGSVAILGGLYFTLWAISKGTWVGFGDVKLGVVLGVLLIQWEFAILTLFLANIIGCLVVLPGLASGKLTRKAHVPFGPFLIVGGVIAFLFGSNIVSWYTAFTLY